MKNIFGQANTVSIFLPFMAGIFFITRFYSEKPLAIFLILADIFIATAIFCKRLRKYFIYASIGIIISVIIGFGIIKTNILKERIAGQKFPCEGKVYYIQNGDAYAGILLSENSDRIRISFASDGFDAGEKFKADISFPSESSLWYENGDYMKCTLLSSEITGKDPILSFMGKIKTELCASADIFDQSHFAKSILLGEKSGLSEEIKDAMQKTGTSHLLAISGLHTSILITAFSILILPLISGRRTQKLCLCLFALFYIMISGFSASVMRAAFMAVFVNIGSIFGRRIDPIASLFMAGSLILIISPQSIHEISFLLSFCAMFALFTVASPSSELLSDAAFSGKVNGSFDYHRRIFLLKAAQAFSASSSILMFTAPILIINFRKMIPVSWIYNILFIPVFPLILILAMLGSLSSFIGFNFGAKIISPIYKLISGLFIGALKGFAPTVMNISFGEYAAMAIGYSGIALIIAAVIFRPKLKTMYLSYYLICFSLSIASIVFNYIQ